MITESQPLLMGGASCSKLSGGLGLGFRVLGCYSFPGGCYVSYLLHPERGFYIGEYVGESYGAC